MERSKTCFSCLQSLIRTAYVGIPRSMWKDNVGSMSWTSTTLATRWPWIHKVRGNDGGPIRLRFVLLNFGLLVSGRILALITSSDSNSSHSLSLFDVARGEGQRCLGTRVHPLQPHAGFPTPSIRRDRSSLEVAHASFSPDGILLALARTDNATHVYDVRYLSEEPLLVLRHGMVDDGTREDVFGVTGLKWVEGYERGRLGLVTGGADGAYLFPFVLSPRC